MRLASYSQELTLNDSSKQNSIKLPLAIGPNCLNSKDIRLQLGMVME